MTSRRKLPSPPLVLSPYLAREYEGTRAAQRVRELALFLAEKNILTQGGIKNLEQNLSGRNEAVSLSLQDVRSWAHGLVQELLATELSTPQDWHRCLVRYTSRFDKGKPRRPTHLQRLYLQWSDDLSWPGLLQATRDHRGIWDELGVALERMDDDSEDKRLLVLAGQCRETPAAWTTRWETDPSRRSELLRLLPLLESAALPWRVKVVLDILAQRVRDWPPVSALVQALRCTIVEARALTEFPLEVIELEALAVAYCQHSKGVMDPLFLAGLRGFVTSRSTVEEVFATLAPGDPLRRVTYGSRPGHSWLKVYKNELFGLCEARRVARGTV